MKEKLIIRNFGPIKDIELDLGRVNILIGEQATGKSTVAKVLAVCRYFSYIVNESNSIGNAFENGLLAWGLHESIQDDSFIFYQCNHYSFTAQYLINIGQTGETEEGMPIESENAFFSCVLEPHSDEFKFLISELNKIRPEKKSAFDFNYLYWTIPTSFYLNDVKNVLDNPFYLPTERGLQSVFSLGQVGINNLESFLFNYFSKIDGVFNSFKTETEIEPLNIVYINDNGVRRIKKKSETRFFLLRNAASGYQSTIPIVLVMKYQNEVRKRKKTFIIEEPELNLFPKAQNELVKFLVDMTVHNENSILLTTHSPYILASINNLLLANKYGNDKVSEVIDKKYWLDIDDVSAYMLLPNGRFEDIIDTESGQIKAEKIDEASQIISNEYEKIMDITYPQL